MNYKVMFTHNRERGYVLREGKEVYRHPEGRFVVLEFQGVGGRFREAFWPEEIVKVEGSKWRGKDLLHLK